MRIVGGRWAGRDLASPRDWRVRPTAEDVRAAVMDALDGELAGARVADLFAGTGALGLEALSRGAWRADFVETRPASLDALRRNLARLGVRDRTRVFPHDALPWAARCVPDQYDVAFVDPPYESRMLDRVLDTWRATGFARVLVAEHAPGHELPAGDARLDFPHGAVTIYRRPPADAPRSVPARGG
jgi:16S rRNA (guanine966-N2)-methyltransferase